ncbi:hypothetical protein IAI10_20335 [Clostridium sp. 19966]|uniref:hypothetical protein n=1 Tax=Clostridium sp. 19966 TaxID=2768166 RepID=UPI0028DF6827|nr:hypothetical protein [Clostridium sp. 19966]MDT8719006.1 hypothetical protein [Clostridium sp. 19966]
MVELQNYKKEMQEKYKNEIDKFNTILLDVNSFARGEIMWDLLKSSLYVEKELKYYLFLRWWNDIDAGHQYFRNKNIKVWIRAAKLNLIFKELNFDSEGYATVYRGENEYSRFYVDDAKNKNVYSWTTDKNIAMRFANGARVRSRGRLNNMQILIGKVKKDDILAYLTDRNENEVVCFNVIIDEIINLEEEK